MKYRIKTRSGYYYTTDGGRYGRLDGGPLYAAVLCEEHANQVVTSLSDYAATKERYPGHAPCQQCEKGKR